MKNKSILFISYFTGFNGNCPAEWADDKLRVLENKNIRTIILTGLGSNAINTKYMKYCKIPSLSWDDFFHEKKMVFQNNNNKKIIYLIFPIILLFGKLIQYATSLITQKGSGGKWSWAIITLFVALYFVITRKVEVVFCTGGPTSSHLVGSIIGKLTKKKHLQWRKLKFHKKKLSFLSICKVEIITRKYRQNGQRRKRLLLAQ